MDRIDQAYDQLYDWRVKDGKAVPPQLSHPLPDFVNERINWLSQELKVNPLTFEGAHMQLVEIDDESKLKKEWELGAISPYLPVSKKYREWLKDPILGNVRKATVYMAFIYRIEV